MPRRPPKRWWKRCTSGVEAHGGAIDPARVCGAQWQNLSPARRRRIVRMEEKMAKTRKKKRKTAKRRKTTAPKRRRKTTAPKRRRKTGAPKRRRKTARHVTGAAAPPPPRGLAISGLPSEQGRRLRSLARKQGLRVR